MKTAHVLLAVLVAAIWGLSFIVVKIGLTQCPPLLLAALRFMVVFAAGVWLFPRPTLPRRLYLRAGLCLGVIQFAGLFSAIKLGMPAGIVAVLAQVQVFITLLLAAALLQENRSATQKAVMALALLGVLLLGYARYHDALPLLPLLLALMGAAGFAWGNIELKRSGKVDMFGFTVWMSAVPPLPLLALSLALEGGPAAALSALAHFSWIGLLALLFLALIGTLFALGSWGKLLSLYPASLVAPFSLLSPVFGLLGGYLILGERYDSLSILASALIVAALALNIYSGRLAACKSWLQRAHLAIKELPHR
ncbi:EamA family transporter [Chromobacterium subtsugae]|uniref:EamA family transporter n=1 Tax=Chromobacterium subtsugae TaxID=251747 RepID=UPI000641266E|nr:EamA family transporter [Chromobacterium subtsugae]